MTVTLTFHGAAGFQGLRTLKAVRTLGHDRPVILAPVRVWPDREGGRDQIQTAPADLDRVGAGMKSGCLDIQEERAAEICRQFD